MNNIFWHICGLNNYKNIVLDQYSMLCKSGLLDTTDNVYIYFLGDKKEYINFLLNLSPKFKLIGYSNKYNEYERPCLHFMREWSKNHDSNILYMHTKGVSRPHNENVWFWRKLLEHYMIMNHKECQERLKQYDVIGINLLDKGTEDKLLDENHKKHFSGNFWWSKTSHIKKLPKIREDFNELRTDNRYWLCERWVLYNTENYYELKRHHSQLYYDQAPEDPVVHSYSFKNCHNSICIVRPTYYDRSAMLQLSLEYQKKAMNSDLFETFIFVDPHPEYGVVSDYDEVINNEYHRINWSKNSGKYSWYDSVKYIFDNTDYEYIISIEDDVLISKDYLKLCEQLALHDGALSKDDNILCFHSGGLANTRSIYKNINKIITSSAASRSILIYRKKFQLIQKWIEEKKNINDNDHMLSCILKHHNMITIAPDFGRDGHFGIYGWSANRVHGNNSGQSSLFEKPLTHEELYSLLKENCLSGEKLKELNKNNNPNYFWDFDPNINFTKLEYDL